MDTSPSLSCLVQYFFTQHLCEHRRSSPRTVLAYRDTFRLLLSYLQARTGRPPIALTMADLDASAILAFLDHLEAQRHNLSFAKTRVRPQNSISSQNQRFAESCLSPESRRAESSPPTLEEKLAVPDLRTIMVTKLRRSSAGPLQWQYTEGKPSRNQTQNNVPVTSGGCVQSAGAKHSHESGPGRLSSFDGSWGGRILSSESWMRSS